MRYAPVLNFGPEDTLLVGPMGDTPDDVSGAFDGLGLKISPRAKGPTRTSCVTIEPGWSNSAQRSPSPTVPSDNTDRCPTRG